MVEYFDLDSFDQLGIRPHLDMTISHPASVSRMIGASWEGAMLYRGFNSRAELSGRWKAPSIFVAGECKVNLPHIVAWVT